MRVRVPEEKVRMGCKSDEIKGKVMRLEECEMRGDRRDKDVGRGRMYERRRRGEKGRRKYMRGGRN